MSEFPQRDGDLELGVKDALRWGPDEHVRFVVFDDAPEPFSLHSEVIHAFGDFSWNVKIVPGPDKFGCEHIDALFQFNDLWVLFPFLDECFQFGVDILDPLDDGGGSGGIFGFQSDLELGQSLGPSRGFDLLHLGQEFDPESFELSLEWCEFGFHFDSESGQFDFHFGYKWNDDVFADVSNSLHDLGNCGFDLGLVNANQLFDLFGQPFQVFADGGLDAGFEILDDSFDLSSDFGEFNMNPFQSGLGDGFEVLQVSRDSLQGLLQMSDDGLVVNHEFGLQLFV